MAVKAKPFAAEKRNIL